MNNENIVIAVYDMLMSASFADWYDTDFIDHVERDPGCKDTNDILLDISEMLNLKKEL